MEILRSLLFVPGNRRDMLEKAIGLGSDVLVPDMEDSVPVSEKGAARAMEWALKDARVDPSEVDYINAHGTSTPMNDKYETMAIKSVFGPKAFTTPISSTKSMTGHLLGASGALEAAICVLAISRGAIPPTINLDNPDPECDLDYIASNSRTGKINAAISNSLGFGGHNTCLAFRSFSGS